MAPADLGDDRVADHGSGADEPVDQGLGVVGAGKSLFSRADRDKRTLRLRSSDSYANGVTKLIYDVVG